EQGMVPFCESRSTRWKSVSIPSTYVNFVESTAGAVTVRSTIQRLRGQTELNQISLLLLGFVCSSRIAVFYLSIQYTSYSVFISYYIWQVPVR
ncbi:hypothetical protein MKW92_031158, partial [Papaver armeniacum]